MLDFSMFPVIHNKDNGKYKVGQKVKYIGPLILHDWMYEFLKKEFVIVASNVLDNSLTEYLLEGFPFLVWEEEIEEVK